MEITRHREINVNNGTLYLKGMVTLPPRLIQFLEVAMKDYANVRQFIRSVPASYVTEARRECVLNYVLAVVLGTGLGAWLALSI